MGRVWRGQEESRREEPQAELFLVYCVPTDSRGIADLPGKNRRE